ncbi:MAG: YeeE/YedE thiosulfate transporter family protein [Chloroflexota bacterium]
MNTSIALLSLGVGLAAGWLGQRSRFCSIGGLRDVLLTGDTTLLRGLLALFVAAWLAYPLSVMLQPARPPEIVEMSQPAAGPDDPARIVADTGFHLPFELTKLDALIFLSGLGVGFFSLLVDGCPFRQHVLAGQGRREAQFYLLGFYLAALVFDVWSTPLLRLIF